MSSTAKLRASYSGIGAMLRAPWMLAEMVKRAETVMEYAQQTAPVGEGTASDPAGGYREGFAVVPVARGGTKKNRAQALVVNNDDAAVHVEYGTVAEEGHHTLLKALDILRAE
jgi:hypothetical protein